MRNRFCPSFRMAENAKRTPELTRKVKNCNVPRNKIKSAIFWQKSYRLEWYLIICHYLNLYVHCISFITRLFLLWKLTGAKSNFETMCLQERNLITDNLHAYQLDRCFRWPVGHYIKHGNQYILYTYMYKIDKNIMLQLKKWRVKWMLRKPGARGSMHVQNKECTPSHFASNKTFSYEITSTFCYSFRRFLWLDTSSDNNILS